MEELKASHRKEQKDLQSRITQKKKSATKKTRKGINEECDRLQRDLLEKQQTEIDKLNGVEPEQIPEFDELTIEDDNNNNENEGEHINREKKEEKDAKQPTAPSPTAAAEIPRAKKGNRQKARLARRAAEREAEADKAAEEAGNQTDHRANEKKAMEEVFKRFNLREKDIAPDGHCLYSSVAFQLMEIGAGLKPLSEKGENSSIQDSIEKAGSINNDGYRFIRTATANFIVEHPDDFSPFLEEPLKEYVRKIRLTSEWGGQLELQAISRAYGVRINVIQGDGRIEKFEPEVEESEVKDIWLAYYRHTYGLGEHYNALTRVV